MVIVVSILLAFGLDAFWEKQQDDAAREEMARAIAADFEATRLRLDASMEDATMRVGAAAGLLRASEDAHSIPLDSLREMAETALRSRGFEPTLSAYRSAVGSGRISDLQNPRLFEALAEFEDDWDRFRRLEQMRLEMVITGRVAALAEDLGTLDVLYSPPDRIQVRFRMTDREYRDLIRTKPVFASFQALLTLHYNMLGELQGMDEAAVAVVAALAGGR